MRPKKKKVYARGESVRIPLAAYQQVKTRAKQTHRTISGYLVMLIEQETTE